MITRRKFLHASAVSLSGLMLSNPLEAFKKKRTLGVQLFTMPKMVSSDLRGTLQLISKTGYKEIEFFGPYEFSAKETIDAWKPTANFLGMQQNAFYGYPVTEVKNMLDDLDLNAPSAHSDLLTLQKNLEPAMKAFQQLGVKHVVIPTLPQQKEKRTLADYEKLAAEFNALGQRMMEYGIRLGYHNHGYEHSVLEGKIPMEVLLNNTDARWVSFEMDIFWLTAGGADPIDFLQRFPNRFKMMHVKSATEPIRFSGDGSTPDQWIALFPKMADPYEGVFDIKGILREGSIAGVEHFYLEHDFAKDVPVTLKKSYEYLSKLP
jgi:sugar phosphate isomerase/epimerase